MSVSNYQGESCNFKTEFCSTSVKQHIFPMRELEVANTQMKMSKVKKTFGKHVHHSCGGTEIDVFNLLLETSKHIL